MNPPSSDVETPGVTGNGRLTAVTEMVPLILLAIEGITIFSVRGMIIMHVYLGVLLLGPLLLKCASTGYRFAQHYRGRVAYVERDRPTLCFGCSARSSSCPASPWPEQASV